MNDYTYEGYAYLGRQLWARREQIPSSLMNNYDRALAAANKAPSEIDPETGRAFGVLFLDTTDEIRAQVRPLLDREALAQDQQLRHAARQRALDAMLVPRLTRP